MSDDARLAGWIFLILGFYAAGLALADALGFRRVAPIPFTRLVALALIGFGAFAIIRWASRR